MEDSFLEDDRLYMENFASVFKGRLFKHEITSKISFEGIEVLSF